MGWFSKNDKKSREDTMQKLPELPKLPDFPALPELDDDFSQKQINQLPSFPITPTGEKFSQSTIKDAITGKRESEKENPESDDFAEEDKSSMRMMGVSPRRFLPEEFELPAERRVIPTKNVPKEFEEAAQRIKKIEPVFIRIDKFEEGIDTLEKAKRQISEIEKMLKEIQKIKEEEEKELNSWESEIQSIKGKIEKIEKDIFSRVE